MLLEVKNLKVKRNDKEILRGIDLKIKEGETQALLGPNGSGKSCLAQTILGNPKYKVTQGKILFGRKDITKFAPEKRVKLGLALGWQNPPQIKGVKFSELLEKISRSEFKIPDGRNLLEREVNVDFSGGEKKISELLQILALRPKLVILDEIDSGLDLKKLEIVAKIIKKELFQRGVSGLLITHSGEILRFLSPALTNIMVGGKIICKQKDYKKVIRTIKKYSYEKCKERALFAN